MATSEREVSERHVWWRLAAAGVPRTERGWIVSRDGATVEDHEALRRVGVRRMGNRFLLIAPTPPPARGEEATCECGDSFTAQALCWVCVADLRATLTATEARLAAIEVSARKVCPLDNNEGYEDEDGDTAFYRCFNEDGDAFIEAEDLPEAVEQIVGSYDKACLALESKDERIHALTRQLAEALQQRDDAVAIAEAALGMLDANDPDALWTDEANEIKARLAQIGGKDGPPDYAAIEQADKESARD